MFEPEDKDDLKHDRTEGRPPEQSTPDDAPHNHADEKQEEPRPPRLGGRKKGQRLAKKDEQSRRPLTARDRFYLLDAWANCRRATSRRSSA